MRDCLIAVNCEDGVHFIALNGPGLFNRGTHFSYHYARELATPVSYREAVRLVRKLRKRHRQAFYRGQSQWWFNVRVVPLRQSLGSFMRMRKASLDLFYGDDGWHGYEDEDDFIDTDAARNEAWQQHREQV